MFARCSAIATFSCFVLASGISIAEDPPRPPQPPFTGETLREWRDDLVALNDLGDNAFLFEEAASDLNRRLLAWQGADVILSLRVAGVTKELVNCQASYVGQVTVRNQQPPAASRQSPDGPAALRIGDVVSLDVARTLRGGDTVVVNGTVATSNYEPGRGIRLAIERSGVVAVVSRSFAGTRSRNGQLNDFIPVPDYPLEALAAGADGEAVVKVGQNKVSLTSGTGNPRLDETVLNAMKRLENNTQLFPGEHRFAFTILKP